MEGRYYAHSLRDGDGMTANGQNTADLALTTILNDANPLSILPANQNSFIV
jgi:hypothetical protein